ncbi:MAG: RsmE family RNA methyltransferase [Verrucomicrobiales bacterium]|nr:RsmE family RNA methyltransferase [Verrucomicrobiales bacterium]
MHRFYLPPEQASGPELVLTGSEAHHALHVLRIRPGDRVTVLDGRGTQLLCEAREQVGNGLRVVVLDKRSAAPPQYQICLAQAMPKPKAFELIIQKATELGAWRIIPLISARTGPSARSAGTHEKYAKWQRTAIEAIKQSGNPWLPIIEPPLTVSELLARKDRFELELVAALRPDALHPRECFAHFAQAHGRRPTTVRVWIGPEGDFTTDELNAIKAHGAQPISLGPNVLRTETAAIYCLAILSYELNARTDMPVLDVPPGPV